MQITILNGNPGVDNRVFNDYLSGLGDAMHRAGHFVKVINLAEMKIKQCVGCWSCWIKTPGNCILNDDMQTNNTDLINCDLLIMSSPIKMGFITALLKRATDRMIPLLTPYFDIIEGKFHHKKRYSKYPALGLILEKNYDTDEEDLDIIHSIYKRVAINFHSDLKFLHLITDSEKEMINAINSL